MGKYSNLFDKFSLNALCESGEQPNFFEKCKKKTELIYRELLGRFSPKVAKNRVPPSFQLIFTPRTLTLRTSFWARWKFPELNFKKRDEKSET